MIETYLQINCDGCGEPESYDVPNTSAEKFRQILREYGWLNYGRLDYCKVCVRNGKAKRRYEFEW